MSETKKFKHYTLIALRLAVWPCVIYSTWVIGAVIFFTYSEFNSAGAMPLLNDLNQDVDILIKEKKWDSASYILIAITSGCISYFTFRHIALLPNIKVVRQWLPPVLAIMVAGFLLYSIYLGYEFWAKSHQIPGY